jgi:hypothetical protein
VYIIYRRQNISFCVNISHPQMQLVVSVLTAVNSCSVTFHMRNSQQFSEQSLLAVLLDRPTASLIRILLTLTRLINRRFKNLFVATQGSKQATAFICPHKLACYEHKSFYSPRILSTLFANWATKTKIHDGLHKFPRAHLCRLVFCWSRKYNTRGDGILN